MMDLGTLQVKVAVDKKQATKDLESAKKQVKSVAKDIGNSIKNAAKATAAGFTAIAGGAVALAESTREYRTEQAKLKTAFESAGHDAKAAKRTYSALNKVLGDSGQATEAANHLALLCDTEEELSTWTDICTGVYATFGDSLPIEGLTESANETAKVGQITGSLADALNWAGINEDDFNKKLEQCSGEQERAQLITETLTGIYKNASDQYKENAEDVLASNEANQKLQESLAKLGEIVEPLITDFKEFCAEGVERFGNYVEEHQEQIDAAVDKVKEFGQFIIDNKDTIIAGLVGIGTGLAVFNIASTVMGLVTAIKELKAAEEGLTTAQAILNIVMNANPLIAVWSVIIGLIAAFTTLMVTNEDFRNKVIEIGEGLTNWITLKMEGLQTWFSGKIEDGKKAVNDAKEWLGNKKDEFFEAGKKLFTGLWDGIKSVWTDIKKWVQDKVDWLTGKLAFWHKGKDEMGDSDGSHRNGLREVPFDGYRAELHRGEMVLTAPEAKRYRKQEQSQVVSNITVNNYSPEALDEAESARQFKKVQRELALGV